MKSRVTSKPSFIILPLLHAGSKRSKWRFSHHQRGARPPLQSSVRPSFPRFPPAVARALSRRGVGGGGLRGRSPEEDGGGVRGCGSRASQTEWGQSLRQRRRRHCYPINGDALLGHHHRHIGSTTEESGAAKQRHRRTRAVSKLVLYSYVDVDKMRVCRRSTALFLMDAQLMCRPSPIDIAFKVSRS